MNNLKDYSVFLARTKGRSHYANNTPCEDFGAKVVEEDYIIFVVADGHGSENCFRSHRGSEFACNIAVDNIKKFLATTYVTSSKEENPQNEEELISEEENSNQDFSAPKLNEIDDEDDLDETESQEESLEEELPEVGDVPLENENKIPFDIHNEKNHSPLIRQLIRSIINDWNEKVVEDFANDVPSEEEMKGVEPRYLERFKKGEKVSKAYGTTLIAAVMTKDYLLILQQGDSHAFLYDENFNYSLPVPWDKNCEGNVTTSICDDDAVSATRFALIDLKEHQVAACVLGTDGVEDSFYVNLNRTSNYYLTVLTKMSKANSIAEFEKDLEKEIHDLTFSGSGDDITISAIADKEIVKKNYEHFQLKIRRDNLEFEKRNIEEAIPQKEGKLNFLRGEKKRIIDTNTPEIKRLDELEIQIKENYIEAFSSVINILRDIDFHNDIIDILYLVFKEDEEIEFDKAIPYHFNVLSLRDFKDEYKKAVKKKLSFFEGRNAYLKKVESMFDQLEEFYNEFRNFQSSDNREKLKIQIDRAIKELDDYEKTYNELVIRLEEINKELSTLN